MFWGCADSLHMFIRHLFPPFDEIEVLAPYCIDVHAHFRLHVPVTTMWVIKARVYSKTKNVHKILHHNGISPH